MCRFHRVSTQPRHRASELALVFVGGALGGTFRFLLGTALQGHEFQFLPNSLLLNSIGAFLVGMSAEMIIRSQSKLGWLRPFLGAGFCGGYTTLAVFTPEAVRLANRGQYAEAGLYIAMSVILV